MTATEIARRLGVPRRTVCDWVRGSVPHDRLRGRA
ncbi:MAG: helix-turn-helix domain-containing protein [Solirubrobacteraceae bacterium]